MTKKIIIASLLFITSPLFAQQSDSRWEIGIDLLPLFNKNHYPEKSLFARYKLKNSNKSFRLRAGGKKTYLTPFWNDHCPECAVKNIYIRPGIQWEFPISDKAAFYYGADLHLRYSYLNYKVNLISDFNDGRYQYKFRDYQIGAGIFAGVKYQPVTWVSISLEPNIEGYYWYRKAIIYPIQAPFYSGSTSHKGKIFDFLPISVINLSFHLK